MLKGKELSRRVSGKNQKIKKSVPWESPAETLYGRWTCPGHKQNSLRTNISSREEQGLQPVPHGSLPKMSGLSSAHPSVQRSVSSIFKLISCLCFSPFLYYSPWSQSNTSKTEIQLLPLHWGTFETTPPDGSWNSLSENFRELHATHSLAQPLPVIGRCS